MSSSSGTSTVRRSTAEILLLLLIVGSVTLGGVASSALGAARFLVGGLGALIMFLVVTRGRDFALVLILIWLTFLGFLRRFLIPFAGWSPQDPLLLVGPACALMLWLQGRRDSPPQRHKAMTFLVVLLTIWSVGQVINPAHLSLLEGAYGALFWVGPLIWFFAGRTLVARHQELIARVLTILLIPVLLHGLYQTFFGFLPFELTWVGVSGFGESIFIGGFKIRPFSTLVSPQEYGFFLSFALTILWARLLANPAHRLFKTALFVTGVVGLFLQGSRSIFVLFVIMLVITSMGWFRSVSTRMAVFCIAISLVGYAALARPPASVGAGAASGIVSHQLTGLMNPTDSTLGLHRTMVLDGFEAAWDNPLGLGTGVTTIARNKVGESDTLSTENDISSAFVSLGLPAGLTYIAFIIVTFAAAIRRFRADRSWQTLATMGLCIAGIGFWWSGGMYTYSAFLWLMLGMLARQTEDSAAVSEEPVAIPRLAWA